jgi:sugar phosphate permease
VVAVVFVGVFGPLVQYLPLVLPPFGQVLASTEGSYALLWSEAAGMVGALVLGAAAIALNRGRRHGIAAVIVAVTVGVYLLRAFLPF